MQRRDLIEQALERTNGNRKLAELLVKVVQNYITPVEDPLYDWQIIKMTELGELVKQTTPDGMVWRALGQEVSCRQFRAPVSQCALAWGHRMVVGNAVPTPVAVLVWATVDAETGGLAPLIGSHFFLRNAVESQSSPGTPTRWFTTDTSLDPRTADCVLAFLNNVQSGAGASAALGDMRGVDLDD